MYDTLTHISGQHQHWLYKWNSPDLVDNLIKAQNMSFFKCGIPLSNRQPKWMLDRKNRTEILKAIDRLEKPAP
jgi:hypothetical protein